MRLPEAALGSVCGFVTLLPILLPFFLGVPAPTAEHCWIAEPFRSEDGFFGYPLEGNDNFVLLFVLYVLANAVSSLGVRAARLYCTYLDVRTFADVDSCVAALRDDGREIWATDLAQEAMQASPLGS